MKRLTVDQVYKMANLIYSSQELDKIFGEISNNDRRNDLTLLVLGDPDLSCGSLFKTNGLGDELHLTSKNGRILYYIVNMWDRYTSKTSPISNEILNAFEVDEDAFGGLRRFGIDCCLL